MQLRRGASVHAWSLTKYCGSEPGAALIDLRRGQRMAASAILLELARFRLFPRPQSCTSDLAGKTLLRPCLKAVAGALLDQSAFASLWQGLLVHRAAGERLIILPIQRHQHQLLRLINAVALQHFFAFVDEVHPDSRVWNVLLCTQ
jgi:hypothetical protein